MMSDCFQKKVQAARQRVVDELAQFRVDSSDQRVASLKAAIDNWHHEVGAWGDANTVKPSQENLS